MCQAASESPPHPVARADHAENLESYSCPALRPSQVRYRCALHRTSPPATSPVRLLRSQEYSCCRLTRARPHTSGSPSALSTAGCLFDCEAQARPLRPERRRENVRSVSCSFVRVGGPTFDYSIDFPYCWILDQLLFPARPLNFNATNTRLLTQPEEYPFVLCRLVAAGRRHARILNPS